MLNQTGPLAIFRLELWQAPRIRFALMGLAIVLGVLAIAWFDGGEEPIRPIVQAVAPNQSDAK